MTRKAVVVLMAATMCVLGVVPALAAGETYTSEQYGRWATPAEYEEAIGKKIENYNEAPELRTLVAAGELPRVEERLPEEPLVVRGPDGIGEYGGTLRMVDMYSDNYFWNAADLVEGISPYLKPYPNVVKSFEMIDSLGKEWIFTLRKGMKWSDGMPFTADDLIFSFNDIALNKELTPATPLDLKSGDEVATIEKIDDYTVKYSLPKPFRFDSVSLGFWKNWYSPMNPKHYLKQFHPKYTDKDTLDNLVKEGGFSDWTQLIKNKIDRSYIKNTDLPTLLPYVLIQGSPDIPIVYKRNPYYWVVDEAGNQLPYLDEVTIRVATSGEIISLKALAGDLDHAEGLPFTMMPLLKKADQEGKIKTFLWKLNSLNTDDLVFNLTSKDPVKREIFRDKRFRFAVSYALDRGKINELTWLGMLQPWQVAPSPGNPFYNDRLAHTALEYDVAKANELLDEMGLDKRDANGFRLAPNGEKLQISFIAMSGVVARASSEIAIDNLKAVGLNCNLRAVTNAALRTILKANDHDAVIMWETLGTFEGKLLAGKAAHFIPTDFAWGSSWAPEWGKWYTSGGEIGEEPIPVVLEAIEYYEKAQAATDLEEQQKWFGKVLDIAADNLWTIGTVSLPGFPYVMAINPKLRNYPTTPEGWYGGDYRAGLFFYEE